MNWQQYKQYLEQKILQTNEENEETYLLHPEAKKQYSPTKEKELILVLTNLIQSIDHSPYHSSSNSYSSLSEQDEEYHSLPDLDNLYTESGKLITWSELFPNRSETHFGKKEEIESEISSATWTILSKIFNDWTLQITRSKRLQDQLGEDQLMGKFLLEAAISLNYDLIKRKHYDQKLKDWLVEYNLLDPQEQQTLNKQKQMVSNLLEALEEEEKNRQVSWYQNIPWSKVLYYGTGTLLILLILGWLWNKFND
ncbi:MAG: hypothetical protein MRERV_24c016 [Mycoplasmataceae bacterium RV_VA103A]|nr:MAG: hypothetical protein MRERV_24c016 [Mycoplasmataceae bacterium RV_VA103A]